jgi:hypothetical protein
MTLCSGQGWWEPTVEALNPLVDWKYLLQANPPGRKEKRKRFLCIPWGRKKPFREPTLIPSSLVCRFPAAEPLHGYRQKRRKGRSDSSFRPTLGGERSKGVLHRLPDWGAFPGNQDSARCS